jgi:hypothetical protein
MKKLILLICCLFNLSYSSFFSRRGKPKSDTQPAQIPAQPKTIYDELNDEISGEKAETLISNFKSYQNNQEVITSFLKEVYTQSLKANKIDENFESLGFSVEPTQEQFNDRSNKDPKTNLKVDFLANALNLAWDFLKSSDSTRLTVVINKLKPILTNDANFAAIQSYNNQFNIASLTNFYLKQSEELVLDENFKDLNDFTFTYLQSILSQKDKTPELNADNLAKIFKIYTKNPDNKELVLFALKKILTLEKLPEGLKNDSFKSLSDLENLFNKDELRKEFALSVLRDNFNASNSGSDLNDLEDFFNKNYEIFFKPVLSNFTADQIKQLIKSDFLSKVKSITLNISKDQKTEILSVLAKLPIDNKSFLAKAYALKDAFIVGNPNLTTDKLEYIANYIFTAKGDSNDIRYRAWFLSRLLEKNPTLTNDQLTNVLSLLENKLVNNSSDQQNDLENLAFIITEQDLTESDQELVNGLFDKKLCINKNFNQIKNFNKTQLSNLNEILPRDDYTSITDISIKFINNVYLNSTVNNNISKKIRGFLEKISFNASEDLISINSLARLIESFKYNSNESIENFLNLISTIKIQDKMGMIYTQNLEGQTIRTFLKRASLNLDIKNNIFEQIASKFQANDISSMTFLQNLSKNAGSNSEKPFSDSQIIEALHASGVKQSSFTRFFAKILPDGIISKFGWTPEIPNPEKNTESQIVLVDE